MKDKSKSSGEMFRGGNGIISILMIFVVLCLVTFGVLSYATAKSDKTMADKNIDNISKIYEATGIVEKCIMNIDNNIAGQWDIYDEKEQNLEKIASDLENIKPVGDEEKVNLQMETDTITIMVDIDEHRAYEVVVKVNGINNESNERYEILKYSVVSTSDWDGVGDIEFE